jgi:hypothetical protein
MQNLDSFISPISGFEGDILVPAISILARDPGAESSEDPSARSSASALRTRAYKRKEPRALSHPKKAKKAPEKLLGGIKIFDPKPKDAALTPPSGTWKGIPILRSKRNAYLQYSFYHLMLIHKLPCRVPQDIPSASPAKDIAPESESKKVDKSLSPSAGKTFLTMLKPPDLEDTNASTGASSNPTSPSAADSGHDNTQ